MAIETEKCKKLDTCLFFQRLSEKESTAALFRDKYCHNPVNSCARMVLLTALGKEFVPENLYPNQHDRVEAIIAANKKQ